MICVNVAWAMANVAFEIIHSWLNRIALAIAGNGIFAEKAFVFSRLIIYGIFHTEIRIEMSSFVSKYLR